jgi:G3E family GTPase
MPVNYAKRLVAQAAQLHIVAIVGALGAGKTTTGLALTEALHRAGYHPSEVTYVVNEAGGVALFTSSYARVVSLPNGCFTCQDEDELRYVLGKLASAGTRVVILEGFGLVSGDEVAAFLEQTGYSYQIVAVLAAAGFETTRLRYGKDMMASHLRVATRIVVTHFPTHDFEQSTGSLMGFCNEHGPGVPTSITRTGEPSWPDHFTTAVLERRFVPGYGHVCGHGCTHHSHAQHNPTSDSSLVHGWRTFWLSLQPSVSLSDLKRVLSPWVEDGVVRVKGVVGGTSFNVAPGRSDWNETRAGEGAYAVLYLDETKCAIADMLDLVSLCGEIPAPARSFQLLRIDTDPTATHEEIGRMLEAFSVITPKVPSQGGLITHPEEMQLLQQMARRPMMATRWKERVYEKCLAWWVCCAQILAEHHDDLQLRPEVSTNERELGVSLAWWAHEYRDSLSADLLKAVRECKPAVLVARGVLGLTQLRKDPFWGFWQWEELQRALAYPGDFIPEEAALIAQANEHLDRLKNQLITVV